MRIKLIVDPLTGQRNGTAVKIPGTSSIELRDCSKNDLWNPGIDMMKKLAHTPKIQMSIGNVLVVDDDIALCRIIDRILSDEQYKVQTAQSVSGALGAIRRNSFDVYLLDYRLMDGTGFDVAKRIWSIWSEAPIIVMSGYDRRCFAWRQEKLRVSEFIDKPFSRETMCNAMKKAIESVQSTAPSIPQSQAVGLKRQNMILRMLSRS